MTNTGKQTVDEDSRMQPSKRPPWIAAALAYAAGVLVAVLAVVLVLVLIFG